MPATSTPTITDALDRDDAIFVHARRAALDWFPKLDGVRFTPAWGGAFGVPRDHMPVMSYDRRIGIATGRGDTGEGVATAAQRPYDYENGGAEWRRETLSHRPTDPSPNRPSNGGSEVA